MAPQLGSKVNANKVEKLTASVLDRLEAGEDFVLLLTTTSLRPMVDTLALTTVRVVAWQRGQRAFKVEALLEDVASFSCEPSISGGRARLVLKDGRELSLGTVLKADVSFLTDAMATRRPAAVPNELHEEARAAVVEAQATAQLIEGLRQQSLQGTHFVGQPPASKATTAIVELCRADEQPWLVIGAGTDGVLAAFNDRLAIIKTGAMTSLMTGALGGGRTTIFPYSQITNIEYNAGFMTGVLEVLTASYQGTANHDFWRGSNKGRNADAGDPLTLSNTLPLLKIAYKQALPHLNELQRMIADSKRPLVTVSAPMPAAAGRAEQIRELAELHAQGLLTDAEFATGKARVLEGP